MRATTPVPLAHRLTVSGSSPRAGVPTNSCLLLDSAAESAAFPRGSIEAVICTNCGFVSNRAFQPGRAEYSQRYEETQGFSGTFMTFAEGLAKRWVEDYDLADKTVLEIGCGKGEFLTLMAKAGAGHCIGIDPGVHPERIDDPDAADIEWIVDFYSEDYGHIDADAVICRHTLEHIPDVGEFMATIRRALGDRPETVVLFELPDVKRVLDEGRILGHLLRALLVLQLGKPCPVVPANRVRGGEPIARVRRSVPADRSSAFVHTS